MLKRSNVTKDAEELIREFQLILESTGLRLDNLQLETDHLLALARSLVRDIPANTECSDEVADRISASTAYGIQALECSEAMGVEVDHLRIAYKKLEADLEVLGVSLSPLEFTEPDLYGKECGNQCNFQQLETVG